MCRLFGFRSAVLSRAHRSLVEAENALSIQARAHGDGWGIGWFHEGDAYLIKSEAGAAGNESFRRASERLASHTFVVHVRKATVGGLTPFNVHPFRHGRWLFAHNGTIHGFDRLGDFFARTTPAHLSEHVLGTTDTEALFFYLLAAMERAGIDVHGACPVDTELLGRALEGAVEDLAEASLALGNPSPIVNFILTNGTVFAANRRGRELWYATQKLACRDAETCRWPDKVCLAERRTGERVNHLLVASERIGDEDRWEEVPEGTMVLLSEDYRLAFRDAPGRARERSA